MKLAITAALLLMGCGASVHSTLAPGTNIGQFRTFSLQAPSSETVQSVADQEIDSSLKQSLIARGYVEAQNGNPDFLVAHHVSLQQRTEVYGGGYGYYDLGRDIHTYTQGTLVVDFIDPRTNKAFWRGTASQVVNNPSSPDAEKIQAAVDKLIKKYPSNVAVAPRTTM